MHSNDVSVIPDIFNRESSVFAFPSFVKDAGFLLPQE